MPNSNPTDKKPTIAIDGPAGAGKSTISRKLAERLGIRLIDTGAIYRCVALSASRQNIGWDDAKALGKIADDLPISFQIIDGKNRIFLDGDDVSDAIRTPTISRGASQVSAHVEVRAGLLGQQRQFAADGGVVLEGRDIGTVVLPHADFKFFLTASVQQRALRRHAELTAKGQAVELETISKSIEQRDFADSTRSAAPLRPADDAQRIDSSALSIDAVLDVMLTTINGD